MIAELLSAAPAPASGTTLTRDTSVSISASVSRPKRAMLAKVLRISPSASASSALNLSEVARLEVDDRDIVAGIGKGDGNAAAHAARAKTCDGGTGAHAAKPSRSSFSSAA
jgi:hypothetical protein